MKKLAGLPLSLKGSPANPSLAFEALTLFGIRGITSAGAGIVLRSGVPERCHKGASKMNEIRGLFKDHCLKTANVNLLQRSDGAGAERWLESGGTGLGRRAPAFNGCVNLAE